MRKELHTIVHGFVQGVFFRRTVLLHAESLNLVGTVRNLPDGTVEIIAQGEEEALERFVERLQNDPGSATIEKIKARYSSPKKSYNEFAITYR